jgi:hypothetical protein
MNAPNDTPTTTPPRSGLRRLISPWAYDHLRAIAAVRFISALILTCVGAMLISRSDYGLAVLPLLGAAAHIAWGSWQLTIARSALPH